MGDTLVIIPAHNEENNIGKVLAGIRKLGLGLDILVVNDGSTDNTEAVLKSCSANYITLPYNLGYGGALQTGYKYASSMCYRYIVQFDGDNQHDPLDIVKILDELKKNNTDIVIGSRFLSDNPMKIGLIKAVAISFFRHLIKILTGICITDPTSGLQGLSSRVFKYYSVKGNFPGDYPDADILIHMLRCSYKVKEIAANIRLRMEGKSMHSGLKPIFYFTKVLLSIFILMLREKIHANDRSCKSYE